MSCVGGADPSGMREVSTRGGDLVKIVSRHVLRVLSRLRLETAELHVRLALVSSPVCRVPPRMPIIQHESESTSMSIIQPIRSNCAGRRGPSRDLTRISNLTDV
ncbi:hypothetical protein GCM10028771_24220 [Nocardioides marmoraquaticus]